MIISRWYEPVQRPVDRTPYDPSIGPTSMKDSYLTHETHKDWYFDGGDRELATRYRHYIDGKVVKEHIEPTR